MVECVENDLKKIGFSGWRKIASDRDAWRSRRG
jgi:hypothetical protein